MADPQEEEDKGAATAPAETGGYCKSPSNSMPGNIYLMSYGFNQDHSCFVCGTTSGFRVYTTSPVCEVHRREHSAQFSQRSVSLIAMLFKTNIFAMVTTGDGDDPSRSGGNKVQIWDDQKSKMVGEIRTRNEVRGVVLRRDVIAVVCEYAIYVYTCDKLRVILYLTTNANTSGLCVLAPASEPWILCCPGQSTGAVRVQVGKNETHVFTAHQTPLACLAVNASGSLVATASESGTVVKVFQTAPDGQLLYRLRRSISSSIISSLAFRSDDKYLAVASSSPTVHIFKLDPETAHADCGEQEHHDSSQASPRDGSAAGVNPTLTTITSAVQKAVSAVASSAAAGTVMDGVKGVMPTYFNDLRSFAKFRIPDVDNNGRPAVDARAGKSNIMGPQVAFQRPSSDKGNEQVKLFVLHYGGVLYECSFPEDPGPNNASGTQDCMFLCATTWFAVRPDFKVQSPVGLTATIPGGAQEGEEEAEEWHLL